MSLVSVSGIFRRWDTRLERLCQRRPQTGTFAFEAVVENLVFLLVAERIFLPPY